MSVPFSCWRGIARIGIMDLTAKVNKSSSVSWGEFFKILKSQDHYLSPEVVEKPLKAAGWEAAYREQGLAFGGATGDFAEVQDKPNHEKMILFGDAEGHSLDSAANSSFLHEYLASKEGKKATASNDPERALLALDKNVQKFQQEKGLMALSAATLNTETGDFKYSNAAMPGLYVIAKSGSVRRVTVGGPPLGAGHFEALHDEIHTDHLEPGETLVFATDGLTDSPGTEGWNFATFLREKYVEARHDSQMMAELVLRDHPKVFDDRSIFAVKRPEKAHAP